MRTIARLALVVLVMVAACEKRGASSTPLFDEAHVGRELERRMSTMFDHPKISAAASALLVAVASSPSVAARAAGLLARLEADPKIAGPIGTLLEQVVELPAMQTLVADLMRQHPGAAPEQIGDLVSAHIDTVWETPAFDAIWNDVFAEFLRALRGNPDLVGLERRILRVLDTGQLDRAIVTRWNERLTTLAGERPTIARGTELWSSHFWANDRVELLISQLLESAKVREATGTAFGALLGNQALVQELQAGAASVLADPAARDAATEVIHLLIAPTLDAPQLRATLTRLLTLPSLVRTVEQVLRLVATDAKIAAVGQAWFDELGADANTRAAFQRLWFGW